MGYELVVILPGRRRNPVRITDDSIINWGRKYFDNNVRGEDIFFVKVDFGEGEKGDFEAIHH